MLRFILDTPPETVCKVMTSSDLSRHTHTEFPASFSITFFYLLLCKTVKATSFCNLVTGSVSWVHRVTTLLAHPRQKRYRQAFSCLLVVDTKIHICIIALPHNLVPLLDPNRCLRTEAQVTTSKARNGESMFEMISWPWLHVSPTGLIGCFHHRPQGRAVCALQVWAHQHHRWCVATKARLGGGQRVSGRLVITRSSAY